MIAIKIDLKKVDKNRLFQGRNGALYLDAVLKENRDGQDQYGNHYMIVESVSKEEREKGVRGAIIGNAKNIGGNSRPQQQRSRPASHSSSQSNTPTEEDPPF